MSNYSEQGGILPKVFSCQHQKTSKDKPTRKIYLTSKGRICFIVWVWGKISFWKIYVILNITIVIVLDVPYKNLIN